MVLDEVWDSSYFVFQLGCVEDGFGVSLVLCILVVWLLDFGVYVCYVCNVYGYVQVGVLFQVYQFFESLFVDFDEVFVLVVELFKCVFKIFWVNEGKYVKFCCYVMGKFEFEIEWYWEGCLLFLDCCCFMYCDCDGGFVFKVFYCQVKDCGFYVCVVCNLVGQMFSVVQLYVKEFCFWFIWFLQDVEGCEYGIVVLECKVFNFCIFMVWFCEDQWLLFCCKYEQIEEGIVWCFIIYRLKVDDDGIYLCEMWGWVCIVVNVIVKGFILKCLFWKFDVLEGENVVLLVEILEVGVEGCWSCDGEELLVICQSSLGYMYVLVFLGVI